MDPGLGVKKNNSCEELGEGVGMELPVTQITLNWERGPGAGGAGRIPIQTGLAVS